MGTYYNIVRSRTEHTIQNTTRNFQFYVQRTATSMSDTVTVKWIIGTSQGYGSWHTLYSSTINPMQRVSFNISNADLLSEMPSRSFATLQIKVARLVNGVETDPETAEYTIRIDGTLIRSVFTSVSQSIQSTPISGYLISGYSTARISYSATKGTGAQRMNFWFSPRIGTATPSSASSTSSTYNGYFDLTTDRRETSFNFDTVVNMNDTRQQYLDTRTVNTQWYGYTKPDITVTGYRCDRDGTRNESGSYVILNYSASYSLTSIGNTGTVTCQYGSTTVTSGVPVAQAENVARTYTVTATDRIDSASKTITIYMAKFPLDLYDDGRGNVGARVGAIAEPGYFTNGLKQKGVYFYGTCTIARATARKTTTVDTTFQLYTGVMVFVRFTNANSVANPTLNVNGSGAIAIKRYGTTAPSTSRASSWNAGSVICFIYDGTYWMMTGWINTTYSLIAEADIKNSAHTTARLIDGQRFKQGLDFYIATGSYVYNSSSTDTITFTDANMIGKSFIICGTQDAGNPVLRATLNSSTGRITVYLSGAVSVMRVNYICY